MTLVKPEEMLWEKSGCVCVSTSDNIKIDGTTFIRKTSARNILKHIIICILSDFG